MAQSERVAHHPVMPALQELEDRLAQAPGLFDARQPDLMRRGRAFARVLRERLQDPAIDIISDAALSNAHAWVTQASGELLQALNANQPDVLANGGFHGAVEAFGQNLGQFPASVPVDALAGQLDEAQRRVTTIQELQLKAAADVRATQDQLEEDLRRAKERVEQDLRDLAEQREASANLLAALGGEAASQGYAETARAEQRSADSWRKVTLLFGSLTAVLALVLFSVDLEPGWVSMARRSALALPFVILALYAGRQAAEHRKEERTARRLQLAFGSVNAYLSDLEPETRATLKSQLSAQLFGDVGQPGIASNPAGFPSTVELVQTAIEAGVRTARERT